MFIVAGGNAYKRQKVELWLKKLKRMLKNPNSKVPPKLKKKLLDAMKSEKVFVINLCDVCRNDEGKKVLGRVVKDTIHICTMGFAIATLLHEMIHRVGGGELDCEAYENTLFGKKDGAHRPSKGDYDKFVRETHKRGSYRVGRFTIWHPKTGRKWANTGTKSKPKRGKELKRNPPTPRRVLEKLGLAPKKQKKAKK